MVGVAGGSAFPVGIDEDKLEGKLVGHLKDEIARKKRHTITVDADMLQLFLAKEVDGEWLGLDEAGAAALVLDRDGKFRDSRDPQRLKRKLVKMGSLERLTQCVGELPAQNQVHVLVVVPRSGVGSKRPPTTENVEMSVGDGKILLTPSVSLDPPALVAFWEALVDNDTEVKADALIELPQDTYILGDPTLGSRIYIRHCYRALWDLCFERIHDEKLNTPHLVILGNPGIGKTFFGFVILLLLARTGATVVYESDFLGKRYLFADNVVAQGSQEDFDSILDQPTTYYIVDALKPAYYDAMTILLTSPRRSIWYEFDKTDCQSCYMPVWSIEEILKCRELMYSDTPVAVVQDCFRQWGGIPRYVLRYAHVQEQQVALEEAMGIVNLSWLMNACGLVYEDDAPVLHRLLHFRVSKGFHSNRFMFASQYVQQEVYNHLYKNKKDRQRLLEFMASPNGGGTLDVLRGYLFEGHVHSVLPRGGTFQVRRLVDNNEAYNDDLMDDEWDEDEDGDDGMNAGEDVAMEECSAAVALVDDGATSVVSLPKLEKVLVFTDDSEVLAAADTSYLQPAVKNYQSVDAIVKPDLLFQVTGAHRHPCKQKGLYNVLKLLSDPVAPRLYFVLPPDRFANFKYQRYLNAKRERMKTPTFVNVRKIQQFALEVKLSSE